MKILMINTYDLRGGAARATWRLYRGLKAAGVEVNLLVQEKRSDDAGVIRLDSPGSGIFNPLRPYIDFAIPLLYTRRRILFSTAMIPDNLPAMICEINPDIVHLNWIAGGFIRVESLAHIKKPVFWTFQDMWAFTGGCHYTVECTRHLQQCGTCPVLHSKRANDLSHSVFQRKMKSYQTLGNLTVTTPSRWLADCVRQSPLMKNRRVEVVPNGLDTSDFLPSDPAGARRRLNLDPAKKLVIFGAIRAVETPLKGFTLLVDALKKVQRKDIQLVVFGSSSAGSVDVSGLDIRFMGMLDDHRVLVDLCSAADMVAVPSTQEVFGQAATEAMACNTPVVAFNATGLRDIVIHRETGYLAEPFDTDNLANGINWILEDEERRKELGRKARERVVATFDSQVVAQKMITLYREVLDAQRS